MSYFSGTLPTKTVGQSWHLADKTQRLTPFIKRGFRCITEVGIHPLIPQPCCEKHTGRTTTIISANFTICPINDIPPPPLPPIGELAQKAWQIISQVLVEPTDPERQTYRLYHNHSVLVGPGPNGPDASQPGSQRSCGTGQVFQEPDPGPSTGLQLAEELRLRRGVIAVAGAAGHGLLQRRRGPRGALPRPGRHAWRGHRLGERLESTADNIAL